jgi:hypothetical protein
MKHSLLVYSTLAAIGILSSTTPALAQDVDQYPIDNGGWEYKFHNDGLEALQPYVVRQADGPTVKFDWTLRTGCMVGTPWIPIEHASGKVTFHPHLRAEWRGELAGSQPLVADLFNFRIERKTAAGAVRTSFSYMDTSRMNLKLRVTAPDGTQSYYGSLANPSSNGNDETFGNTVDVDPGDQVRLLVCDVWPGVGLTITQIVADSIPLVTN